MWISIGMFTQNFIQIRPVVIELQSPTAHSARRTAHGGRHTQSDPNSPLERCSKGLKISEEFKIIWSTVETITILPITRNIEQILTKLFYWKPRLIWTTTGNIYDINWLMFCQHMISIDKYKANLWLLILDFYI